jgi:hypothetical protein
MNFWPQSFQTTHNNNINHELRLFTITFVIIDNLTQLSAKLSTLATAFPNSQLFKLFDMGSID